MMQNRALMKFQEFQLKGSDLKALPKDQAAMISLLFASYNEVNTLLRLFSLNSYVTTEPKPVLSIGLGVKLFLMRELSAKLFETVELLEGKKSWNKTSDPKVKKFTSEALDKFKRISSEKGHKIAQALRNDLTGHYSLQAARKNIGHIDDAEDLTYYIHKTEGNSYSQLGEAVVFGVRFSAGRLPGDFEESGDYFEEWMNWSMAALRWLKEIIASWAVDLLPTEVRSKWKHEQKYLIDEDLVGELGKAKSPLFLREPRS